MTKPKQIELTQKDLHKLFIYKHGDLYWKNNMGNNRIKAGTLAGHIDSKNRRIIKYKKRVYKAHRLIWIYVYGYIDNTLYIDHINRKPYDNRIENLRLVTIQENSFNTDSKGYYYHKDVDKWRAAIFISGKIIHLGYFNTEGEAKYARMIGEEKYYVIEER